jgi:hypothetical protein
MIPVQTDAVGSGIQQTSTGFQKSRYARFWNDVLEKALDSGMTYLKKALDSAMTYGN